MSKSASLLIAAWCGCSTAPPAKPNAPVVEVWGALREMIHEGRTEARVAIASAAARPHAYALGAIAGMRGEVTIVDGVPWISIGTAGAGHAVAGPTSEGAALLVASSVAGWRRIPITQDIPSSDLERRIEAYAAAAGFDVERPIPFLLEGSFTGVRWHVLKGPPAPGSDPHDHAKNAAVGEQRETSGTVVGFFSKHHQGVFTHMGQNAHLHIVEAGSSLAAHVDELSVRAGSVLALPSS